MTFIMYHFSIRFKSVLLVCIMGTCFDANARIKQQDEGINMTLRKDRLESRKLKAILLTGTANSGKTTMLKQIKYLPEAKLFYDNIESLRPTKIIKDIRQNCIDNIITLCEINDDQKSMQLLQELSIDDQHNNLPQVADIISNIWDKHSIKSIYKYRFSYGGDGYILHDNMESFFDKIHEIMDSNYNPSEQDIITSKTNSTKTTEIIYLYDPDRQCQNYSIIDVPYLIEKEFIHQFDDVISVIFVASLTDYCIYYEGMKKNQMHAALNYFDQICNSRWFKHTMMIIFLNKEDLFRKSCIEYGISLRQCFDDLPSDFPEYSNPKLPLTVPWIARQFTSRNGHFIPVDIIQLIQAFVRVENSKELSYYCYDEWADYIKKQFEDRNTRPHEKRIYTHLTCAVDKRNMQWVFKDVHRIVLRSFLMQVGLI